MATQQQKFSFPLLKPPDILQCLYELEIRMSEEELNQCDKHRESVRRVFEQLMEMCIGVTKEELAQPAFAGLQSLNYPELHEDSVSELAHFRAIHRVMEACGVHDFSVMDMLAPNHKRLKRQLSAVINFAKFREERIGLYAQLCAARDERLDTLQRTKNEAAELSARLATAKERANEDNAEIDALERENGGLEAEIERMNAQQLAMRDEAAALKQRSGELKAAIGAADAAQRDAEARRETLASQVVSSPARVRGEMAEAARALEEEHAAARRAEADAASVGARVENAARARTDCDAAAGLLSELEGELSAQQAALDEVGALRAATAAHDDAARAVRRRRRATRGSRG